MIESLKQRGHQRRIGSAQAAAQSKPGLQCSGESGIKEIVLPWEALLLSGILLGSAAQNRAFLLPARSQLQKDNSHSTTEDWPVNCRLVASRKRSARTLAHPLDYSQMARKLEVVRSTFCPPLVRDRKGNIAGCPLAPAGEIHLIKETFLVLLAKQNTPKGHQRMYTL